MTTATLFIVSAPSGAGKTSMLKSLVAGQSGMAISISHTTRQPRPGEVDGVHYHYVSRPEFERMVEGGEFLEHAQVFDNFYGTAEAGIRDQLTRGEDVILEIDWQGARQVRKRFPEAVSIFILPPTPEALRERLGGRGQDSEEIIERRMRDAQNEMSHYPEYDYLIVNDQFDIAVEALRSVIVSQQMKVLPQSERLAEQLKCLLA